LKKQKKSSGSGQHVFSAKWDFDQKNKQLPVTVSRFFAHNSCTKEPETPKSAIRATPL
jgi:hypothetical protein